MPEIKLIGGGSFEIGPSIRGEFGPPLKEAVATEALLDNTVTASHYQVGAPDALGSPIALGRPMSYLDWTARSSWGWYIYRFQDGTWKQIGTYPTKEEAITAAATAAAALEI